MENIKSLFILWGVLILAMATGDAFSPILFQGVDSLKFRMAWWLSLLFAGMIATTWTLIYTPIRKEHRRNFATIITLFITGGFFGLYNITWQSWMFVNTHNLNPTPVTLVPFPVTVNIVEWYAMIALGVALMIYAFYWARRIKNAFIY